MCPTRTRAARRLNSVRPVQQRHVPLANPAPMIALVGVSIRASPPALGAFMYRIHETTSPLTILCVRVTRSISSSLSRKPGPAGELKPFPCRLDLGRTAAVRARSNRGENAKMWPDFLIGESTRATKSFVLFKATGLLANSRPVRCGPVTVMLSAENQALPPVRYFITAGRARRCASPSCNEHAAWVEGRPKYGSRSLTLLENRRSSMALDAAGPWRSGCRPALVLPPKWPSKRHPIASSNASRVMMSRGLMSCSSNAESRHRRGDTSSLSFSIVLGPDAREYGSDSAPRASIAVVHLCWPCIMPPQAPAPGPTAANDFRTFLLRGFGRRY